MTYALSGNAARFNNRVADENKPEYNVSVPDAASATDSDENWQRILRQLSEHRRRIKRGGGRGTIVIDFTPGHVHLKPAITETLPD